MSKKKNASRLYGQIPTPAPTRKYSSYKVSFNGLNEKSAINSGNICDCINVSFDEYPYVTTRKAFRTDVNNCRGSYYKPEGYDTAYYIFEGAQEHNSEKYSDADNNIGASGYRIFASDWSYAGNNDDTIFFLNPLVDEGTESDDIIEEGITPVISSLAGFVVHKFKPGIFFAETGGMSHEVYISGWTNGDAVEDITTGHDRSCVPFKNNEFVYFSNPQVSTPTGYSDSITSFGLRIDPSAHFFRKYRDYSTTSKEWIYEASISGIVKWSESTPPSINEFNCMTINNGRFYFANAVADEINGFEKDTKKTVLFPNGIFIAKKDSSMKLPISDFGEFTTESTDSWASVSDDEAAFVGLIPYNEMVIGFKRNSVYTITRLKNPFLVTRVLRKGCVSFGTVCEIGEYIYFLSDDGVNIFNGSTCKVISHSISFPSFAYGEYFKAGTDGRHYYLFVRFNYGELDESGNTIYDDRLYVYDTLYNTWTKWDWSMTFYYYSASDEGVSTTVREPIGEFFYLQGRLFFAQEKFMKINEIPLEGTGKINYKDYSGVEWSITFDVSTLKASGGVGTVDIKHVKQFKIFADIAPDATFKIEYSLDNEKFKVLREYEKHNGENVIHKNFIISPYKSANTSYKLRLSGEGYCKLYEIETITEDGGSLYD